jgi:hypothetical protein
MRKITKFIAATACLLALAQAANADSCKPLTRVASLDMKESPDGRVLMPVTLDGQETNALVDFAAPYSVVDSATAASLHLITERIPQGAFYIGCEPVGYVAKVHELRAGDARAAILILVDPLPAAPGSSSGLLLGDDFLKAYDLELDFAQKKLNLYLPDHCPGVVYWPASAVAVVPIQFTGGFPVVQVLLEGKPVDAVLSTTSSGTIMTAEAARDDFGITPDSPGVTAGKAADTYDYTFKSLELDGIQMANVPVIIHESNPRGKIQPDTGTRLAGIHQIAMTLGMHELSRLHLYVALHEGRVYATP